MVINGFVFKFSRILNAFTTMPQPLYDIHQHFFNKGVIVDKIAKIAVSLTKLVEIADNDDRKFHQIIGNVEEFLERIGTDDTEGVYAFFNTAYQQHLPNDEMVFTPLTFDLTYADDTLLDNPSQEERLHRKRKRFLNALGGLATVIREVGRFTGKRDLRKLGEKVRRLSKRIRESDDLINDENFKDQVEEMEALVDKYGKDHIQPFYSVEPRQTRKSSDAIDYIPLLREKILNDGARFHGVKLYCPVGFSPTDPVLMDPGGVYEFCQENQIPITVHCSDAGFATLVKSVRVWGHIYDHKKRKIKYLDGKVRRFEHEVISLKAGHAIAERANTMNHPKLWELVVSEYKNLKINLAHFGGSGEIMEMVHHTLPERLERFPEHRFNQWINSMPAEHRRTVARCYNPPTENVSNVTLRKELFYPDREDSPQLAWEKEDRRIDFWELLYDIGKLNNWSKYILEMIQSDKYPNLYTDLSAFSEGHFFSFSIPRSLCVLNRREHRAIRQQIGNQSDVVFFDSLYKQTPLLTYILDESIPYPDQVRLLIIFRRIGKLGPGLTGKINTINKLVNSGGSEDGLIEYLVNNEKFSILLELNAFKEKLYDQLDTRHQEKILYGSDFYFTQLFGPRHEQFVQDFVNAFGTDFEEIARKHPRQFLYPNP